jgi:hypothetical protein
MCTAILVLDGACRGNESLTGDLTAEHSLAVFVGTRATEDVAFDRFEIEEVD